MIITPNSKKELILSQLEDLNLYHKTDKRKDFTHIHKYQTIKFDFWNLLALSNPIETVVMSAISIKFPKERLSAVAKKSKIETPLTYTQSKVIVKYPYMPKIKDHNRLYNFLSATERQECMHKLMRD